MEPPAKAATSDVLSDAQERATLVHDSITTDGLHPLARELKAMLDADAVVTVGDLSNIVERLAGELAFAPSAENGVKQMTLDDCMEALSQPFDEALDEADLASLGALLESL